MTKSQRSKLIQYPHASDSKKKKKKRSQSLLFKSGVEERPDKNITKTNASEIYYFSLCSEYIAPNATKTKREASLALAICSGLN